MKYVKLSNEFKQINEVWKSTKLDKEDVKNIFQDLVDASSDRWNCEVICFSVKWGTRKGEYFNIIFKLRKKSNVWYFNNPSLNIPDNDLRENFIHGFQEIFEEMKDRIEDYGVILIGPNRTG